MIEQNVQLVRCQGDRIWVRLGSQTGCTACDNGKGCGAGLFAKLLQRKPVMIELERNDIDAVPGQMVTLTFPEKVYLKLVMAYYGWPLLLVLTGAIAGHGLGTWLQLSPAWIDAITFIGAVVTGGFFIRFIEMRSNESRIVNSLQTTVCYSSDTPNMCSQGKPVGD